MSREVLVIDLNPTTAECHVCGVTTLCKWGLPVWNGDIVANDWPFEWGGVPACRECFEKHERGELTEIATNDYRQCDCCLSVTWNGAGDDFDGQWLCLHCQPEPPEHLRQRDDA